MGRLCESEFRILYVGSRVQNVGSRVQNVGSRVKSLDGCRCNVLRLDYDSKYQIMNDRLLRVLRKQCSSVREGEREGVREGWRARVTAMYFYTPSNLI